MATAPLSLRTALGPLAHDEKKKNGHDNPPPDDGGDVLGDEA